MKKTLVILAVLILLCPLQASAKSDKRGRHKEFRQSIKSKVKEHRMQQREENKGFRQSLKKTDMARDQKLNAIRKQREKQYGENSTFHKQIHNEVTGYLSDKLAKNEKLTDSQKQEILNHKETQYQENTAFRSQQHGENLRAIEQILGNEQLSPEERRTQSKEFRASQREEKKKYRQAQREENKTFRQSFRTK